MGAMRKKGPKSLPAGILRVFKKVLLSWAKLLYVVPFFIFGLWLVCVVFFPGFDLNASISLLKYQQPSETVVTGVLKKEEVPRDHFHMVDDAVAGKDIQAPICAVCHGEYVHGKDEKLRALLNLHDGFMDCTVCHVRKGKNDTVGGTADTPISAFLWVDGVTGEFKTAVAGQYGNYSAKIFPVLQAEGGLRQVPRPITEAAARQFLETRTGLSSEALEEARKKLHAAISKEAVACKECHVQNGYIDFRELGFSQQRVDDLVSSEFVGMFDKYETFYLPSVIDFSGE